MSRSNKLALRLWWRNKTIFLRSIWKEILLMFVLFLKPMLTKALLFWWCTQLKPTEFAWLKLCLCFHIPIQIRPRLFLNLIFIQISQPQNRWLILLVFDIRILFSHYRQCWQSSVCRCYPNLLEHWLTIYLIIFGASARSKCMWPMLKTFGDPCSIPLPFNTLSWISEHLHS